MQQQQQIVEAATGEQVPRKRSAQRGDQVEQRWHQRWWAAADDDCGGPRPQPVDRGRDPAAAKRLRHRNGEHAQRLQYAQLQLLPLLRLETEQRHGRPDGQQGGRAKQRAGLNFLWRLNLSLEVGGQQLDQPRL